MFSFQFGDVFVSTQFLSSLTKLPKEFQPAAKGFVAQFKQKKLLNPLY